MARGVVTNSFWVGTNYGQSLKIRAKNNALISFSEHCKLRAFKIICKVRNGVESISKQVVGQVNIGICSRRHNGTIRCPLHDRLFHTVSPYKMLMTQIKGFVLCETAAGEMTTF